MPKQYLTINKWSGGMNNRKDPRDLEVDESSFIKNMSIDALGKIKSIGGLFAHQEGSDGTTNLTESINDVTDTVVGGYNMFYFESDHSRDSDESIIYTVGTTALTIGTADGNINFNRVESNPEYAAGETSAPETGSGL
tara:strand:- start:262 stop:675 length:414 start_codon:yes stop_codon:yes gene_type:complete